MLMYVFEYRSFHHHQQQHGWRPELFLYTIESTCTCVACVRRFDLQLWAGPIRETAMEYWDIDIQLYQSTCYDFTWIHEAHRKDSGK